MVDLVLLILGLAAVIWGVVNLIHGGILIGIILLVVGLVLLGYGPGRGYSGGRW